MEAIGYIFENALCGKRTVNKAVLEFFIEAYFFFSFPEFVRNIFLKANMKKLFNVGDLPRNIIAGHAMQVFVFTYVLSQSFSTTELFLELFGDGK